MAERSKEVNDMQKIAPFLWFDGKAEEAAKFYTSIFKNSKIGSVSRYGEAGPGPKGTVMSVTFELDGQRFYQASAIAASMPSAWEASGRGVAIPPRARR
jgi:predicted 3-demethylubiquinone-9 3-methyltransferase (glyoxalase superfamily)